MNRVTRLVAIITAACIVVPAIPTSGSEADNGSEVRVSGSRYAYFTISYLSRVYMDKHPRAKVQVTASDPDTGLNDLIERQSDGIMVLGPLGEDAKEEARERGLTLETQLIGWSGVAVVTHPQNPVDSLTIEQLRKIFLGEITNWKEVGGLDEPIVPITRDEAISGTERLFRQFVLKGFPVAQNTVRLFDYDVVSAISKQRGSIADARLREGIRGRIKGLVKVIAIRNDEASPPVLPSSDTIQNQSYPMAAPVLIYYDALSVKPAFREFANFCSHRGLIPRQQLSEHRE